MELLEVTPARLATAADSITDSAASIDTILDELQQQATKLRSQWSGEAQLAFDAAQGDFATALTSRTEAVTLISTALRTLAEAYSEADLNAARALGVSA